MDSRKILEETMFLPTITRDESFLWKLSASKSGRIVIGKYELRVHPIPGNTFGSQESLTSHPLDSLVKNSFEMVTARGSEFQHHAFRTTLHMHNWTPKKTESTDGLQI